MSDEVRITYDQMEQIASTFQAQADSIASMHKNLRSAYEPLEGGDWMGKGAGAFFNKMQSEIFPSCQKLEQGLEIGASITRVVSGIFHNGESEAKSVLDSLDIA